MGSAAIVRVFCVDGPCHGEQDIDLGTGCIASGDDAGSPHHVYRIDHDERIGVRTLLTAYFDHTE
jgi:predicted RNA methylase